ncbi:MAG TPA: Ldh family oxidoreductase [Candidatus Methylomirabilis sp.]|nr:Ldh family oxidoreductase [Candidatus Methylomirabilis sp.]
MEDTGHRFDPSKLSAFCVAVLEKAGVPRENAEIVAHSLLAANVRGVDTHGITRLPIYVERLQAGLTKGRAQGVVISETPTTAVYDGQDGLGQVVGTKAMRLAIAKAESAGVGLVTARNSTHYGTAGYYAMMALDKDMIGIALTNSPSLMAPWGGKRAYLGSNPIAIAVPAGKEKPFVLDMATTVVARGAIILAAKKGETIPISWGLNKDGEPTTNAKEANEGALLPLGGHKGYGLAMAIEVLVATLAGGPFGPHIGELYKNPTRAQGVGHFFGAIRIDRFRPVAEFKADMDAMIREVKAEPLAKGFDKIMVAGEPEFLVEQERREKGVPLSDAVVNDLSKLGASIGIPFDA